MIMQRDSLPPRARFFRAGAVVGLACLLCAAAPPQPAKEAPPAAPVGPVLNLADCLHLARQTQPTLRAAQASLASAQAGQRGLNELGILGRLSKELPYRKDQASHGVAAAAANLCQVQRDVDASVARLYYAVIYAREQMKVATAIVTRLKAVVANGQTLLGKEGAPADLNPVSVERAKMFLALAESRVDEANRGLSRATAALREAMGSGPELHFQVAEDKLPPPLPGVSRDQIMDLAMSHRGEVSMANSGVCVTRLEIEAQQANRRKVRPTAARGADVHSRPVPTGSFGDDYKPGAIGLDFPSTFVGPREARVDRACEVNQRAEATAEKARILVALEAEDAFLKWEEAMAKIAKFTEAAKNGKAIADKVASALDSGVIQSYRDVLEIEVMAAQFQAHLNEALYNHAVALTELERTTGGAFATLTVNVP
jgi:outer membrane protein TolC